MDVLVAGGTLLTMRGDRLGIVDDGAVAVDGDRIAFVGPADESPDADRVVDATGCVVLPGLVNAHAHTAPTLLRGGAQDVPEIEWMNRALGPLASRLTPEDRVLGARLGAMEAVRAGATTVCEYADHVGRLVEEVYRPLGVHCVAVETVNEVPDDRADLGPREPYPFDRERGRAALDRADALHDAFGDDPLITPGYGPQALDMVSLDRLEAVFDRAAARGSRVHMHVAQGERERLQIRERYGTDASTVSVLDEAGALSESLVAVHCHGATPAERSRLVEAGASMVGCSSSIAAIDGVVPPVAEYREAGGTVGLGTDQAPGPGHHDVLREARTAATLSKVDATDPTALPAWVALRLVTVEGARALGVADEVGTLAAGTRADLAVVDLADLGTAPTVRRPLHTAVPNLVYAAGSRHVRDVFVAGEAVVRDGEFVDADPDAVIAAADRRAREVFEDATEDWRRAGSTLVDRVDEGWL